MKLFFILILILSLESLFADDSLESLLDDITEISTKTKLNIDYQPSVVSVMHAEKLKKIGIRNLHEAIGLLPGVETSILHAGWKQVIFRGAYNPDTFIFDKYKLYIDGVDVGSDLYSTSYYYLDFPIELIDRIEVLRGSASTIYGPGAFSGAINVITKSSKNSFKDKVFASLGSYQYYKGGFVKHLNIDDWHIAIDSYFQANNKTMDAGSSFVSNREVDYQRTDYNSLENFKDFSFGLVAQKDGLELLSRYKSEKTDNYYGMIENLEPTHGGYQHNESAIIELKYSFDITKKIDLNTKIGLNYYSFEFDTTLYNDYQGSGLTLRVNPAYKQLSSYIDANFNGKNLDNHDWMLGVGVQKINTLKNIFGTTTRFNNSYGGPTIAGNDLVYLDDAYGFLDGNNNQLIKSIYFQDIYSINQDIDLSLNLRLDDYALFKKMYSHRLGAVYRLDDTNILKAVYGRSYRAPSYVEAFQAVQDGFKNGNENLKPELIDTYELAYTHKNRQFVSRTNIFYSIMKDVMDAVENEPSGHKGDYSNHKKRILRGIESELTYQFRNSAELMLNFSYVRTQFFTPDYYNPVEYQSPEISEVLSKGYLLFPLMKNLSFNTAWYYSGPKKGYSRGGSVSAKTIDSTLVVDETIVYNIDGSSMVTLSAKNLFNTLVYYPSFQQKNNEIKREGRNWLLTYEKQF